MLEVLNHPKPATHIKTDNSTATGFLHKNTNQKRSNSWDMRYHWLRERYAKKQLNMFWDKESNNLADYFPKHHPAKHHLHVRDAIKHVRDCQSNNSDIK